jgi:hypothetical protein
MLQQGCTDVEHEIGKICRHRMPQGFDGHLLPGRAQGFEVYQQERGAYPDMVVLNSNSWDIAQLGLSKAGRDILKHEQLPRAWLQDWIAAAESLFRLLKVGLNKHLNVSSPQSTTC